MENTTVKLVKGNRYTVTKDNLTLRFYPVTINTETDECEVVVYYPRNGHVTWKLSSIESSNPTLIHENNEKEQPQNGG